VSFCRPIVALILMLLAAPATAVAEEATPPAVDENAAAAFRQGGELYSAGRYREALGEFQRAHELAPHSANLFNMARCHENLGDAAQALSTYREALEGTLGAEERTDIERRIAGILERPVRVFITSEPGGATVLVDAREATEAGTTPTTVELVPGAHRVILSAEGHLPTAHRLDVVVGEQEPVAVTLPPIEEQACPECEGPRVVEQCNRVDLEGLHAHLGISFPIVLPLSHFERDVQLLAGVGVTAALTHNQVYAGARFNLHPYARETDVVTSETGEDEAKNRSYSMFFTALEAGYVWGLEVAAFRLSGGVAFLADVWTDFDEATGVRTMHSENSLFGWASVGLDVHALRWLSIGLDGGLAVGAGTGGGFGLFGTVTATLTFHL